MWLQWYWRARYACIRRTLNSEQRYALCSLAHWSSVLLSSTCCSCFSSMLALFGLLAGKSRDTSSGLSVLLIHVEGLIVSIAGEHATTDEEEALHRSLADTLAYLGHLATIDLAQAVAHLEPQAKARRVRELFYERKAQQMRDICPWLTPPSLPRPSDADISWRWQMQCQMSWYIATPQTLLPRGPLRTALAIHLGLPVFPPGQRCHYTPLTTGRRCNHQLGQHSDHVHACAQAASVRRHNRMRDVWHQLCRQAGWHAQTEQLVFTRDGTCKRADIVALSPEGAKYACDVTFTSCPTPAEPHGPHLERTETAKAALYHTVPWGKCHEDAVMIPLVHDANNRWMPAATLRLLHRIIMATATATAPTAPRAWGAHLARTTHSVSAILTHAACISLWQMHAACGCLL